MLSVIGGTLPLRDHIVTAALSVVEGFHHWVPARPRSCSCDDPGLGVINWLAGGQVSGRLRCSSRSPRSVWSADRVALPAVPGQGSGGDELGFPGATEHVAPVGEPGADHPGASGVEAVANMTGLMKEPVPRPRRRPSAGAAEAVVLNIVFGIALTGAAGDHERPRAPCAFIRPSAGRLPPIRAGRAGQNCTATRR